MFLYLLLIIIIFTAIWRVDIWASQDIRSMKFVNNFQLFEQICESFLLIIEFFVRRTYFSEELGNKGKFIRFLAINFLYDSKNGLVVKQGLRVFFHLEKRWCLFLVKRNNVKWIGWVLIFCVFSSHISKIEVFLLVVKVLIQEGH